MTEENGNQKNIADWVEKRSSEVVGRRQKDAHQCVMHDYMFGKQDDCLKVIKDTIKTEVSKGEHRFELFDLKLDQFITKWALGIIASVVGFLTMIIVSLSAWQFVALRDDVKKLSNDMLTMNQAAVLSLSSLKTTVTEIGVKQEGVVKFIEGLEPEHQELMDFLRHNRKKDD